MNISIKLWDGEGQYHVKILSFEIKNKKPKEALQKAYDEIKLIANKEGINIDETK